jgi:hypothetical protein
MISIKEYPANKEYYIRLMKFGREVLDICKSRGITPVVWGSLAYFGYTKDKNAVVHDIDFLVPKDSIKKIMEKGLKHKFIPEWNLLQIFKDDLKIEFDPIEEYYTGKENFEEFEFDGLVVKVVRLKDLIQMYKKASEVSKDKPEQHCKKYEELKKLIS